MTNKKTQEELMRLAHEDLDFLCSDASRSTRMKLEFDRVDRGMSNINSTITVFGSARLNEGYEYDRVRHICTAIAERGSDTEDVILTGGGPGVMEAANRGAYYAGRKTAGVSIELPFEQTINPYCSDDLVFQCKYFSVRKFMMTLRARAIIGCVGGLGTLEEVAEVLTLKQTGILQDIPIILVNKAFWRDVFPLHKMMEYGTISYSDLNLYHMVDNVHEVMEILYP